MLMLLASNLIQLKQHKYSLFLWLELLKHIKYMRYALIELLGRAMAVLARTRFICVLSAGLRQNCVYNLNFYYDVIQQKYVIRGFSCFSCFSMYFMFFHENSLVLALDTESPYDFAVCFGFIKGFERIHVSLFY